MQLPTPALSARPLRDNRMRDLRWLWLALALALAAGPALIYPNLEAFGAQPEFLTLLVVWHGLHGSTRGRYLPAMLAGFARDLFSAGPFGVYAVLYAVVHRLLGSARGMVSRDNWLVQILVAGLAVLAVTLGAHGVIVLQGAGAGWMAAGSLALTTAAVTAPLLPLLHLVLVFGLAKLGAEQDSADNWTV